MPKNMLVTVKTAAVITVMMLGVIGVLAVCDLLPRERITEWMVRALAVMAVLTAVSLGISYVTGIGQKAD